MLAHHVTNFPLQPEAENVPENLLFNLLGCSQLSYAEVIQENYCVMVHTLHPDKNKDASVAASKYIPAIKANESSSTQHSKMLTLVLDCLALNEMKWALELVAVATPSYGIYMRSWIYNCETQYHKGGNGVTIASCNKTKQAETWNCKTKARTTHR